VRHFKASEYQALTLLASAAYKSRKNVLGQFLASFWVVAPHCGLTRQSRQRRSSVIVVPAPEANHLAQRCAQRCHALFEASPRSLQATFFLLACRYLDVRAGLRLRGLEFVAESEGACSNPRFAACKAWLFAFRFPTADLTDGKFPEKVPTVPLGIAQNKVTRERNKTAPSLSFSDLEAEVIGLFVQISRIIGQPRSYAEIYAVLFMSPDPLTMDELIERLGISKGSASQGLNFLRKAGAIRMLLIPGRRPAHYEAVPELRQLAAGFLRDQVLPQVEESQSRLNQIVEMVGRTPEEGRAHVRGRISMLQSWGKRTRQFLPLVVKMLGG